MYPRVVWFTVTELKPFKNAFFCTYGCMYGFADRLELELGMSEIGSLSLLSCYLITERSEKIDRKKIDTNHSATWYKKYRDFLINFNVDF